MFGENWAAILAGEVDARPAPPGLPLLTLLWQLWLSVVVGTSCLGSAEAFAGVDFAVFVQKTQAPF